MLFSSISFLYYFLPIFLLVYFIVPNKFKNTVLLVFSLLFYFYGEGIYILILIGSCLINYFLGILIEKSNSKKRKLLFIIALIFNIGLLIYFKYTNFFINNINSIFNSNISIGKIIMPLGISFFTFQTIGYIVDIYNNKIKADHSLIDLSCYITMFPQLVAGPIVRYETIKENLKKKNITIKNFSEGIQRFIIGLSKKVLLANSLGSLINVVNSTESVLGYWIIAISYTLQIYFDFSGYSDMAIGLGKMLGFDFLENFNYPYIAKSITDFWRRWHISLSSFFKDYIYIPLGGNKTSKLKWIRNILIVWGLTGFWHGASWNFIIWGLFFAFVLLIEKFSNKKIEKIKGLNHFYTIFIIIISFVIFNANNLTEAINSFMGMFGILNIPFTSQISIYYLESYSIIILISIIFTTPIIPFVKEKVNKNKIIKVIFNILETIIIIGLLIIVTSYLIDASFNPFLYFRF